MKPMSKADRELLELAALAGGHTVVRWTDDGTALLLYGVEQPWNSLHPNPHSDCMGDALRLAVKLRMEIDCELRVARGHVGRWKDSDGITDDPDAATRRAITIAASEIGRAMKAKI